MLSNEDGCQFQLSGGSAALRACQQSGVGNRIGCVSLHCCQADWWRWWRCPQGCSRSHEWRRRLQEAVQSWLGACSTFWRAMSTEAALCLLPTTPDSLAGQLCTCFPTQDAPVLTPDLQTPTCSSKVCTSFPSWSELRMLRLPFQPLPPNTAKARSNCLLDKARMGLYLLHNLCCS